MFWAQSYNKYGTVVGSRLDHDSVKLNAENMGLTYNQANIDKEKIKLPNNTSMVFITHVGPRTGEIYPIDNLPTEEYLSENSGHDDDSKKLKQFRPLRVADVTQTRRDKPSAHRTA